MEKIYGILYNKAFFNKFDENGLIDEKDTGDTGDIGDTGDMEELEKPGEPGKSEPIKESINLLNEEDEKEKDILSNFKEIKLSKIGVAFTFKTITYCEGCKKRKDKINPNRVTSMKGSAFLYFESGSSKFYIKVSNNGITWTQLRTENMNPPKPISQEVKEVWNNPNQGFGLVGLGLKKLGGGLKNALFGSFGSSKLSEENLECEFESIYSSQNANSVAPEEEKDAEEDKGSIKAKIESILGSKDKNQEIEWDVNRVDKKTFECTASLGVEDLIKFSFKIK